MSTSSRKNAAKIRRAEEKIESKLMLKVMSLFRETTTQDRKVRSRFMMMVNGSDAMLVRESFQGFKAVLAKKRRMAVLEGRASAAVAKMDAMVARGFFTALQDYTLECLKNKRLLRAAAKAFGPGIIRRSWLKLSRYAAIKSGLRRCEAGNVF
jgi:hypothetical protein